jgi:hypothetical protein
VSYVQCKYAMRCGYIIKQVDLLGLRRCSPTWMLVRQKKMLGFSLSTRSVTQPFSRAIQFAVTKFLATGSQVPLFAAITLRVQKPLSNSSEGLFWVKFV